VYYGDIPASHDCEDAYHNAAHALGEMTIFVVDEFYGVNDDGQTAIQVNGQDTVVVAVGFREDLWSDMEALAMIALHEGLHVWDPGFTGTTAGHDWVYDMQEDCFIAHDQSCGPIDAPVAPEKRLLFAGQPRRNGIFTLTGGIDV
jgi:hypothetical protein